MQCLRGADHSLPHRCRQSRLMLAPALRRDYGPRDAPLAMKALHEQRTDLHFARSDALALARLPAPPHGQVGDRRLLHDPRGGKPRRYGQADGADVRPRLRGGRTALAADRGLRAGGDLRGARDLGRGTEGPADTYRATLRRGHAHRPAGPDDAAGRRLPPDAPARLSDPARAIGRQCRGRRMACDHHRRGARFHRAAGAAGRGDFDRSDLGAAGLRRHPPDGPARRRGPAFRAPPRARGARSRRQPFHPSGRGVPRHRPDQAQRAGILPVAPVPRASPNASSRPKYALPSAAPPFRR